MDTKKIIEIGGTITFDDISHLDQLIDISMIVNDLKEDLFQAVFPHEQIIDIGWYPEFCENGTFRCVPGVISLKYWNIVQKMAAKSKR